MPGSILVVDDSATFRSQIRAMLVRGGGFGEILEAGDGLTALKILVERRPDLVICDLVMPGIDGMKFLALRAARKEVAEIPVIMLTAEDDIDRKVDMLDRGAADYVTKPFHEKELLARVRVHLRLKQLQDELRQLNARLETLSATDPLTGLCNRRDLDRRLVEELKRTVRYGTPLSIIAVDVDHFKQVNDGHGHAMGDEVLRNIARVFLGGVRSVDTVARVGGEEIIILLPHTARDGALQLAERLRAALAVTEHTLGDATIRVTASFGVACLASAAAAAGTRAEALVARADAALYRAKAEGRNRVIGCDPDEP